MKRKLLALMLTIAMVVSIPVSAFAEDSTGVSDSISTETAITTNEAVENEIEAHESEAKDIKVQEDSTSEWTAEDFTYGSYEQYLYGCDYSREFTIKGRAITGFSDAGIEKLDQNKDLVIPATDEDGTIIVAIAQNAFYNKGLTSVKFPSGMMVDYDDTVTNRVTKRGNFIIAENAFANNNLTSVTLPEGVIACMSYAFNNNKITTVKLPRTIWWLETMSFSNNRIATVNFPTTCDFQLEMHGLTFAKNFIRSVRLPDFTEVVNKHVFAWNEGRETLAANVQNQNLKTYEVDGTTYNSGVVYMYADNAELEIKDRIHHTGKVTASQHSDVQKLVINDGTPGTQNPDAVWTVDDFTFDGTVVTGLSESGKAKREANKDLVIPDQNKSGQYITEIAAAVAGGNGLFGNADGLKSVELPNELTKIGNFAFQNCGLEEVQFPARLEEIGNVAFQTNKLTSVILPDTVTKLGTGAFATNPNLERISLSKNMTTIPDGAFGCSDAVNYMTNLRTIDIHEGITSIGQNAFAGNNFGEIDIPGSVEEIKNYAFSTKNYLKDPCTVTLNEGLKTIGTYAFRNKVISEITLPKSVTKINKNTFEKTYSDGTEAVVTKIYVPLKNQYEDKTNFPDSDYHKILLLDASVWTAEDFIYAEKSDVALYPAGEYVSTPNITSWAITGFSEEGLKKNEINKDLVIPDKDPNGMTVQAIGNTAFRQMGITSLTLPEGVKTAYDDSTWTTAGEGKTERGDFFIGSSAFIRNELKYVDLPEGVIHVGNSAFAYNQLTAVKLPSTIMMIGSQGFANNSISSVDFPAETDFPLQMDSMCFAVNQIKSVQLPSNTEKVTGSTTSVFFQNTGMEPVTTGTTNEKKGGIVYMYKTVAGGNWINHLDAGTSNVQKLIIGSLPEVQTPWNVADFTYNEDGDTITGLSDKGKSKITSNPALILPDHGPSGSAITALGAGTNMSGIFVYSEGEGVDKKNYSPKSVILPKGLKSIGNWAFALNGSLTYENEMTSISLPDGLETIGQTAFQNSKLTSVSIPDSVKTMGAAAFTTSLKLTSIKLSKNVKDIPQSAFTSAGSGADTQFESLIIPEGVENIGNLAFSGAPIEELTLPGTLKTIGQTAFGNHQLTELEIPGSVISIGNYAFRISQEGLQPTMTNLTLNEGLVTIGTQAFTGNSIITVDLPSTVRLSHVNSSTDAIFGTATVPANPIVTLKTSKQELVDEYNTVWANTYSHIVVYDKIAGTGWTNADFAYDEEAGAITGWSDSGNAKRKNIEALVLPDKTPEGKDIVAISNEAFKIPDDEVEILKFGINSPNGMISVDLPVNLEKIGNEAFSQNALTKVDFEGIKSIGERAFYGNRLTEAELPDTVIELGSGAFATNDITNLRLSSGVTKIPQGAFSMNIRLSNVTIPNTVTEIGQTAFAGARLTALTIPKSVEKIGEKAFHLHHLRELTIPGNVKQIGESAFEGTYKDTTLSKLIIEEGVESLGKHAFKEGLLETVHFPNSIKTVGEKPFLNNMGKGGSNVVEVTTKNKEHLNFIDDTYKVVLLKDDKKPVVTPKPVAKKVVKVHTPVKTIYLKKKSSATLPVKAYNNDGTAAKLKWKSNKKKVATVTQKGKIKAKKTGTAKITATAPNGKKITITVKVVKKAKKIKKITIKNASKKMKVGSSKYLTVKVGPKKATKAIVKWTSSKKSVISVDKAGKIIAKKRGKAKITAKVGKVKYSKVITVN